jgi:Xaa-Pro aminopeptidase
MSPHNSEFAERRQKLLSKIPPNSLIIISSALVALRNGDVAYPYRQRSNFYYLTGFREAESVLLLYKEEAQHSQFILFSRPSNAEKAKWDGHTTGQRGACLDYGADAAYPIKEFAARLPKYLAQCTALYFLIHEDSYVTQQLSHAQQINIQRIDLSPYLDEMRSIKQPSEIAHLRQGATISSQAHQQAMRFCRPGHYEYEIEAELLREFYRHGSQSPAYPSIIAGGENACILHYHRNNSPLKDGDLCLIDAGCEYQYYAADISRTFPVNGRFTTAQRKLYEIVLNAQMTAISAIKPGICWDQLESIVCEILTEGLLTLGILSGKLSDLLQKKTIKTFYPHRIGHSIGLDVHDTISTPLSPHLEGDMVVTIEPGLYIPVDSIQINPEYRGIGIRIEDEVLITAVGHEILSAAVPKTVDDIEQFMQCHHTD